MGAGIDLLLLNMANAYDGLACLFGIRNHFGFRPSRRIAAFRMTPRRGCGGSSPTVAAPARCTGRPG